MYVAVTRARQRLYLSFARTHAARPDPLQPAVALPRRGSGELVKWLTPRARQTNQDSPCHQRRLSAPYARISEPRTGGGFRIGQSVMHHKFGLGVIINAEGGGSDARVQVNFGAAGIKWLALSVAKLEAA
jgi:DNA helicase-2/ATP-dependent DNA helicase PcrA